VTIIIIIIIITIIISSSSRRRRLQSKSRILRQYLWCASLLR